MLRGSASMDFEESDAKRWAKRVKWVKLHVVQSVTENSNTGYVEFAASYVEGYRLKTLHENSKFIREADRWYYVSGTDRSTTSTEQMISRSMDCPCGSHRKFKNCHGT